MPIEAAQPYASNAGVQTWKGRCCFVVRVSRLHTWALSVSALREVEGHHKPAVTEALPVGAMPVFSAKDMEPQAQQQSTSNDRNNRRKRCPRVVMYLGLLAAAVFLAYQVHVTWMLGRGKPTVPPLPFDAARHSEQSQRPATLPATGLADMLGGSDAGLEAITAEPGGLAPPPKAVRRWAFKRAETGEEYARYGFPGRLEDAAEHYVRLLKEQGGRLVSDQSQAPAKRLLVFDMASAKVIEISLHKAKAPADTVDIGLRVRQVGQLPSQGGSAANP